MNKVRAVQIARKRTIFIWSRRDKLGEVTLPLTLRPFLLALMERNGIFIIYYDACYMFCDPFLPPTIFHTYKTNIKN
jgi:hypothetical protein